MATGTRSQAGSRSRTSGRGGSRRAPAAIPQLGWDDVRPAPVVLVSGPETVLADRAARALREELRSRDPSLEVTDVAAAEYAPGELLTLASPSLFGEPRLIRVDQVEKCNDAFLTDMLAYLETPAEDTVVLLRHRGGVRGKKLLDAVRAGAGGGIEVVCAEVKKPAERHDFVAAEFRRAGVRAAPAAVRALTEAFTGDLAELAAACGQLVTDTGGTVTEESVRRYYGGRVETTAFAVADAAIAGQHGEALIALRHALDSGADPVPLVAAFASKIRTMARVSGTRGGSGAVAARLGLAPWQVERAQRDLRGWDQAGLARCIEVLAATDHAVKGAGRDPVFALERMVGVVAAHGTR